VGVSKWTLQIGHSDTRPDTEFKLEGADWTALVEVVRFAMRDTIEEKMLELQRRKRELAQVCVPIHLNLSIRCVNPCN
jgi:hypothetical protein